MSYVVHTDGSCYPNPGGPGGWAAVVDSPSGRRILTGSLPSTTNNRAELTTVLEAMRSLDDRAECVIRCDSAYVVRGVNEWSYKWQARGFTGIENPDLWREVVAERDRLNVTIEHVRGHNGDEGNEMADRLAGKMRLKAAALSLQSLDYDQHAEGVHLRGGAADEAPEAYKPLEAVLAAHTGTVEVVHTLRPLGVAMAPPKTRDPYKD